MLHFKPTYLLQQIDNILAWPKHSKQSDTPVCVCGGVSACV